MESATFVTIVFTFIVTFNDSFKSIFCNTIILALLGNRPQSFTSIVQTIWIFYICIRSFYIYNLYGYFIVWISRVVKGPCYICIAIIIVKCNFMSVSQRQGSIMWWLIFNPIGSFRQYVIYATSKFCAFYYRIWIAGKGREVTQKKQDCHYKHKYLFLSHIFLLIDFLPHSA